MALTADEYKALIVLEVGDTADQLIATNVSTFWALYDDLDGLGRLQYLYAKRKAIETLMGSTWKLIQVEIVGDSKYALQQRMTNLQTMLDACDSAIGTEAQSGSGAGEVVVGQLTTTAPIASPTGWPDANDPGYSGDPNRRSLWDLRGFR